MMKRLFFAYYLFAFLCLSAVVVQAQWLGSIGPINEHKVNCLAVSNGYIFAGTSLRGATGRGGVFRCLPDGGTMNWIRVGTGLPTDYDVFALVGNSTNVFAGGLGGAYLSTDNGTNWTLVNSGLPASPVFVWALAVVGTNVFAGTNNLPGTGNGVFRSTDNGTSWTSAGLTNENIYALAVSGTNLFAGTCCNGVFLSTNNGTTWTPANSGLTNPVNTLAVRDTNLFAGTGNGVFLSTNKGTSWTPVNSGLTNTNINALAKGGTQLFAGTQGGGVFRTSNNGANWVSANSSPLEMDASVEKDRNLFSPNNIYALVENSVYLYAGYDAGVVRRPCLRCLPLSKNIAMQTSRCPMI